MGDAEWSMALQELADASERLAILARCLGVGPELARWRNGEELGGRLAADGLDQARGALERLVAGGAKSLLELVDGITRGLPIPLE